MIVKEKRDAKNLKMREGSCKSKGIALGDEAVVEIGHLVVIPAEAEVKTDILIVRVKIKKGEKYPTCVIKRERNKLQKPS